jgi:hypothetical protein
MASVWLVTNGGDGSDGDEWLLNSVHATEASAKAAAAAEKWHREVEEWPLEGPLLADAEREAIEAAIQLCEDITYGGPNDAEAAATLRSLLERLK